LAWLGSAWVRVRVGREGGEGQEKAAAAAAAVEEEEEEEEEAGVAQ
jgi:hypothetical protein